jgi:integrase
VQITTRHMESAAVVADQWFVESGRRGEGAFLGRITPAGGRLFYFRYADANRKQVRLPIGAYSRNGTKGGLTVADARAVALGWAALYKSGISDLRQHFADAAADEQRAAEVAKREAITDAQNADLERKRRLTVRELFDRWAATELTPHPRGDGKRAGRKDGGRFTREQFARRVFAALGDVPAVDVRKADVLAILDAVKAEGKLRTANVLLADLKQMFRFAADREVIPHSPIETVRKKAVGGRDVERDRVLSSDEVAALAVQLPLSSTQHRSAIAVWLILATGCRIGELMNAQWQHIDTVRRTWHLPETKNQRPHTIHLSDFALRQIEKLAALRDGGAWLFPNTHGDGPVNIKSLGKQLADRQRDPCKRLMNRAADTTSLTLPGGRWTAHDLRRTAATLMAGLGVSTDVIDECLNHKLQSKVARVYIHDRRTADQAKAFDALGALLTKIVQQAELK